MVSRLLSLGATQRPDNRSVFPLVVAAEKGFVGVVRVLISEGGARRAVGGDLALANALHKAVVFRRAPVLRLLLTVDGEEKPVGVGQHKTRGQVFALLWRWRLLSRRGEHSPRGDRVGT